VANRPPILLNSYSLKEGMRILTKDPIALFNYVNQGIQCSVDRQLLQLCNFLGWRMDNVVCYLNQIRNNGKFQDTVKSRLGNINYGQVICPEVLYVIVRELSPYQVVETGVSAGVSSAYILQALEDNGKGKLYSIDLPNIAIKEAHTVDETGFVIPDYLRQRWSLRVGKSYDLLRPLLAEIGNIDMFLHDSEHTYNTMQWEYEVAWMSLDKNGLIVSHDINDNSAFCDFAHCVKRKYKEIFFTGIGVIKK